MAGTFFSPAHLYVICIYSATVLLTHLEYFNGVIIMTTNRIMTVDIAVQSRITYAVKFGHLTRPELEKVWNFFVGQLDDTNSATRERADIQTWFEANINEMESINFNGRDIRNLFHSAQMLASKEDDMKICLRHISTVFQSSKSFCRDLERKRIQDATNAAGC